MRAAIVLLAAAVCAGAQSAHPAYEAASLKLNTSGDQGSSSNGTKGQVVMTNMSLHRLIERAWRVKPFQVSGPVWLDDIHFDIAAKYPPDTTNDDRLLMLRTLLEERLKLVTHHESKEMPGYALVVAKSGFKLKPVAAGDSDTTSSGAPVRNLTATKVTMANVAELVSRYTGSAVVDKTAIEGVYDFALRWLPEEQTANTVDPAPFLATALQDVLGLRLQPQKVPVDVIVVDKVERAPVVE